MEERYWAAAVGTEELGHVGSAMQVQGSGGGFHTGIER